MKMKLLWTFLVLVSSLSVAAVPSDDFQTFAIWKMDVNDGGYVRDASSLSGFTRDLKLDEDRTANGFTAQASITTGSLGVDDEALYFPGLSVARANPFWDASLDQISIDFWMKVEAFPGADASNTSYLMASSGLFGMYFSSSNRLNFTVYNDSNSHLNGSTPAMVILAGYENQWIHVTAEFNKDLQETNLTVTDSIGNLIGSNTQSIAAPLNARAADIQIGGWIGKPAVRSFNGWLDNVKFSSDALSSPVLADDYQTVALWHNDTDAGGYIEDDDSVAGSRNNDLNIATGIGTFTNPTIVSGLVGNALSFDGYGVSQAYGAWTPSYDEVEIDMWLKVTELVKGTQYISYSGGPWELYISSTNRLYWRIYGEGNVTQSAIFVSIAGLEGQWLHVVAKYDSELNVTLNVNGTVASGAAAGPMWQRDVSTYIDLGGRTNIPTAPERGFIGLIDEVKISCPSLETPLWKSPYVDEFGVFGLWHMNSYVDKNGTDAILDDDANTEPARDHDLLSVESGIAGSGPIISTTEKVPSIVDPNEFGNSMYFDGYSDLYLEADTINSDLLGMPRDNFRIEAWFKVSQDGIDYYEASSTENALFYVFNWNDNARIYIQSITNSDNSKSWRLLGRAKFDYPSGTYLEEGVIYSSVPKEDLVQWHHVALEYYHGEMVLYLDGNVFGTKTISQNAAVMRTPGRPIRFGIGMWGWLDEAKVSMAVSDIAPCGFWGYSAADINKDCYVNIDDLAEMASQWIDCTDPQDVNCQRQPI